MKNQYHDIIIILHSILFGHDWASYSSYEDHIKTGLNAKSFSTIWDGSQRRFIVLYGCLWLEN